MSTPAISATIRAVRSGKKAILQRAAIVLTQAAVNKMRSIMAENKEAIGVKISVRTRGCNGLSYVMGYVTEKGKMDEEVTQNGVSVFIDYRAQLTLLGTEMDYVETKIAKEFVFHNPNAKGTCGCGESFHV